MLQRELNNWEIFKIPPIQPIQYYSILKKKREFSQLIKQYDAKVCKHGCLHFCSIVPENISSSSYVEYELLIIFLENIPSTSFIGFRVNVNNETFIHESNSLLLFLKQSNKAELYFVNNNCIHVQCGKDAWEIFYNLYGIYLKKCVQTVIGTQFFHHFVYQICVQNEKQLLDMLFRGSKVIRVSKMSIYYRIHQKRKISVTDLIHMTMNMPESKRRVLSFDSKESLPHSNIDNQNIYTLAGSKINVSKLVINEINRHYQDSLPDNKYTELPLDNTDGHVLNFHSKFVSPKFKKCKAGRENRKLIANNSIHKRKFYETERDENEFQNNSFFPKSKVSNLSCLKEESKWEQYTSLKPYAIKSYSTLLPSNSLIPNLFDNRKSCEIDSLSDLYSNAYFHLVHSDKSSVFFVKKCLKSSTSKESCDIYNVQNQSRNFHFHSNSIDPSYCRDNNVINICTKNTYNTSKDALESNMPTTQMLHQENLSILSPPFSKSTLVFGHSKLTDQGETNATVVNDIFTTASGKSINISNNAMLAAQRFIQGMFQNEIQQEIDKNVHCSPVYNKQSIKVPTFTKNSVLSCTAKNYKDDKIISKSINYNDELSVCFDKDSVSFSTAAGKAINVSQAAMKEAHKRILDSYKTEEPSTSSIHNAGKKKSTLKDIGFPPIKLLSEDNDNTIDKALIEKIFEDAVFDEKELKDTYESSKDKDIHKILKSTKSYNSSTCKIRKSLGGRRSMRFYSTT